MPLPTLLCLPLKDQTPNGSRNKPRCSYFHAFAYALPVSCKAVPCGLCLANPHLPPPLLGLLQEALCDLFCLPGLGEQSPFLCLHISQCITLTARVAKSAHTVITTASESLAAGQGGLVKGGKQDSLPFCRLLSSALPLTYRLRPASLLYYCHLGAKGGNCTFLTIQHLIWLN